MNPACDTPTDAHAYDWEAAPCMVVYSAIAELEGCSPVELDPLAVSVDPEAVDELFAPDSTAKRLAFEYCGYDVEVTPGEIRVRELSG